MTSNPASRRARAMILAPRSWPSNPTLPTRSRSLRSSPPRARMDPSSEIGFLLAVFTQDRLQGTADLAEGCVRLHRPQNRRHQIGPRAGGVDEFPQRACVREGVPFLADLLQAAHLCRFHRGRDLQNLDGLSGALGVPV